MKNQFGVSDAHKMFSHIYKDCGTIGLNLVLVRKDDKVITLDIQDREILRDARSLKKLTDSISGVEYQKIILVAECWAHTPEGKSSVAIFVEYQQTGIKCWMSSAKGKTLGKLEPMEPSMGFADSYFMRLVA
jgi:gamma-glutamylcysteine synthetase